MKSTQAKATKQALTTPTHKQSPLNYPNSQNYLRNLKQSSHNAKLVSVKPDQNLSSPVHFLQKSAVTTQTPSRSSGKMLYMKNNDPASSKSQLEKFAFEKSLEIDVYATHGHPATTRGLSSGSHQTNQKQSLSAREVSLDSQQQRILENFAKKSPNASSQTQAKLLVMLQKDPNTTKNSVQGKAQQYNSPKVTMKNAIPTSSNKENVNTLNSPTSFPSELKSGGKKSAGGFLNASNQNNNIVNESSDTLRLGSVEKDCGDRCINHPHKKAKYFVVSEDGHEDAQENISPENKYCSKCAIKFAGKGLKIQELLSSPQELRKAEVEEFLIRLSEARRTGATIIESINKKRHDIETFYSKQSEKADLIISAFLEILNEEKTRALEEMTLHQEQTFEEIEDVQKKVEDRLNSITMIHQDIEKHQHNIVNNIENQPFTKIMSTYNEKLNDFLSFLDSQVLNHQINVAKLPGFKQNALEELRPTIISFFTKNNLMTSLIKREAIQNLTATKNKRASQEDGLGDTLNKSSLHISFGDKEIFGDAINSCRNSSLQTEQQAQNQVIRRCSDLYSYSYGLKIPQVRNDSESLSKSNDSGRGYNTLSGHEPKGIVKKTDIDLGSLMENKSLKTPQAAKNQQNASTTAHSKRPMSYQVASEQRFLSNPSTSEFYGQQISLQQSSFDGTENSQDIPTSRYSNIGGNSSYQAHNRHESCPSPRIVAINTQGAADSVFDSNFASQSNRSTKKYINILEKISSSQTRKNAVYSDMLKSNTLLSPRYDDGEEDPNEGGRHSTNTQMNDHRGPDNFGRPLERMTPDNGWSSRPDNNPQKELKHYAPFSHFIESQINNEKAQQSNTSYQKTLFCTSPNFKENIEPTEEYN